MYLHIGKDMVVSLNDIIGIFDIETASISKITREYLKQSDEKKIISVTNELPKSFIVCRKNGLKNRASDKNKYIVYISQISTATLHKRLNRPFDYAKDN